MDKFIANYETNVGPAQRRQGSWPRRGPTRSNRPAAARRTARAAIKEARFSGGPQGRAHRRRGETPTPPNNVVVCTLCSCYPWPVLRAAAVLVQGTRCVTARARGSSKPRRVLAEMGLELADDVQDHRARTPAARVRWLVLPPAPRRHRGNSREEQARTAGHPGRDGPAWPGVAAPVTAPLDIAPTGHRRPPPRRPRANGELVFAETVGRAGPFGMAVTLYDSGCLHVGPSSRRRSSRGSPPGRPIRPPGECWSYYQHWLGAPGGRAGSATAQWQPREVSHRAAAAGPSALPGTTTRPTKSHAPRTTGRTGIRTDRGQDFVLP